MDGLSTPYRLSKEQSWLLHHVHILQMVLLALNLWILYADNGAEMISAC